MQATTVAVDLAKPVFQFVVADEHWHVTKTQRLTRTQFERWFVNRCVGPMIMESCGSAHYWARWLNGLGIEVRLLPAKKGNRYLRMLLTHGARSVLRSAKVAEGAGKEVCGVRRWTLEVRRDRKEKGRHLKRRRPCLIGYSGCAQKQQASRCCRQHSRSPQHALAANTVADADSIENAAAIWMNFDFI